MWTIKNYELLGNPLSSSNDFIVFNILIFWVMRVNCQWTQQLDIAGKGVSAEVSCFAVSFFRCCVMFKGTYRIKVVDSIYFFSVFISLLNNCHFHCLEMWLKKVTEAENSAKSTFVHYSQLATKAYHKYNAFLCGAVPPKQPCGNSREPRDLFWKLCILNQLDLPLHNYILIAKCIQ